MGGGRRDSANTPVRSRARWFATVAIGGASFISAGAADAVEAGDSQILYFERLNVAAPRHHRVGTEIVAISRAAVRRLRPPLRGDAAAERQAVAAAAIEVGRDARCDLYRGQIDGAPQSWARIGVADGELHGMLWDGADLYVIEPIADLRDALPANTRADADATAIFRLADVMMKPGATSCGADTAAKASKGSDAYGSLLNELKSAPAIMQAVGATRRLEISVLGDSLFVNRFANEAQARAEILVRLNNVDGIFSSQLGVEIQVPSIDYRRLAVGDHRGVVAARPSWRDLRKRSPNLNSRGLTHLFTGRDLDGTTVGIAYVDSLCDRQYGAGLSEASGRSALDRIADRRARNRPQLRRGSRRRSGRGLRQHAVRPVPDVVEHQRQRPVFRLQPGLMQPKAASDELHHRAGDSRHRSGRRILASCSDRWTARSTGM